MSTATELKTEAAPLVVIVDDELDYAESLKERIKETVTTEVVAVSTIDALQGLNLSQARCLILDLYLGNKDTHTAIPFLEGLNARYPELKIILHSGYAEPVDIRASSEKGIYSYVPKDLDYSSELLPMIRSLIPVDEPHQQKQTPDTKTTESGREDGERASAERKITKSSEAAHERDYQRRIDAYESIEMEYQNVVTRIVEVSTSGRPAGMLPDSILRDLIDRTGARGGAWFLLNRSLTRFRSLNCELLCRLTSWHTVLKRPRAVLGSKLHDELTRLNRDDPSNSSSNNRTDFIGEPIALASATNNEKGIFDEKGSLHGAKVIEAPSIICCSFPIGPAEDRLVFVLELPEDKVARSRSALSVYVLALKNMVALLPLYISRGELGKVEPLARRAERGVSWWQAASRGGLSLLALALFAGALISTIFAFFSLLTATLGFPDILSWSLHWAPAPTPYGVGIVNALELFILAITLYLLGVGLSCMMDHPRISRVPPALRYLDDPDEMKRSLALAICTLLAVAGLKAILQFSESFKGAGSPEPLSIIGLVVEIFGISLLIIVLTVLVANIPKREE
jgi:CheY-like chemotaxis protein